MHNFFICMVDWTAFFSKGYKSFVPWKSKKDSFIKVWEHAQI